MNDIATIIVTYNGERWINKCLNSLKESEYKTDIYIIDNASTDNTIQQASAYSDIQIIENNKNLGFGQANNEWLRRLLPQKKYKYFFLLNQDAWVDKSCIGLLKVFLEENRNYGIVSPLQYNKEFTEIDFNFSEYLRKAKNTVFENVIDTTFVNAAVWLLSRKCIEKTGGFNPYFQHYGEDNNFCDRSIYKGFKIGIIPKAKANHDRERIQSFDKILKLSKIRLECIILDPGIPMIINYLKAFKYVLGIPKYYSKSFSFHLATKLAVKLFIHYIHLLFFGAIKDNYNKQKKDLFL